MGLKKTTIIAVVTGMAVLLPGLLVGVKPAHAEDCSKFPFCFVNRDRSATYHGDLPLSPTNPNFAGGRCTSNCDESRYREVSPGTTIDFDVPVNNHGTAKSSPNPNSAPADVYVWVTIDIRNSTLDSISNISGNGVETSCPGSGGIPVIKNYRVEDVGATDASPVAYNPSTGGGVEDCQEQGRMVYWRTGSVTSSTNLNESFSMKVKYSDSGNKFCLRQNVSVRYPSDPDLPNSYQALRRVAEQSYKMCYEVKIPTGGLSITCNRYALIFNTVPGGGSQDFKIIHRNGPIDNPTGGFTTDVTGTAIAGVANGLHTFARDRTYFLKVVYGGVAYSVAGDDGTFEFRSGTPCNGSASSKCLTTTVSDPSSYDPPGGMDVAYSTNTIVNVSDDLGRSLIGGNYRIGKGESHTFKYFPEKTPNVYITIDREYHNTSVPGGKWVRVPGYPKTTKHVCYRAKCELTVTGGIGPGGIFVAGQAVNVVGKIINDLPSPTEPDVIDLPQSYVDGQPLSLSFPSPPPSYSMGTDVQLGTSEEKVFTVPANSGVSYQTVTAYPDYYGAGGIGSACSVTFPVYAHFNIQPQANITNFNAENPTIVTYQTTGTKTEGPDISANAKSWLTKRSSGSAPLTVDGEHNVSHTYGTASDNYSYANPSVVAGDEFCAHVTISPANGWKGPASDSDIVDPHDASADSGCSSSTDCAPGDLTCCVGYCTVNHPYTHTLGADVSAGGGFTGTGTTCADPGQIKTYSYADGTTNPDSRPIGSGSQFAALAIGTIDGFTSANLRGNFPTSPIGLSFANEGAGVGLFGGELTSTTQCVPDYWAANPLKQATPNTGASTTIKPGNQYFAPTAGRLTLTGGSLSPGQKAVIYVKGDVVITGNISLPTSWANLDSIPSVYVVASGNISLTANVTRLDGIYVAQPFKDASGNLTKGTIRTCTDASGNAFANTDLFASCKQQLLVNGAFVAQTIFLDRTYSSLRYGHSGEHYDNSATSLTPSASNCGQSSDAGTSAVSGDCAAEIFNLSPDFYLSNPGIIPKTGPTKAKYDYITGLAPVM